ncbi:MAG: hypothetical protein HY854_11425 [Burkholderiales bacterium]|nr:hypothetical protein [Burkholderiales bacterium]
MRAADLPADVRRFILTSIPSVPYLEAVLLLRSADTAGWDAAAVARRLYVPEKQAADLLQQLAGSGIASEGEPGTYRYAPATDELRLVLDGVAEAYATNLVTVADLIHARLDKRAQQFADAFRLRKE